MAEKPTNGTIVSFGNTPQAKDDNIAGLATEDTGSVLYLDVMANDLAGKGKALWSVDDGISAGGERPVDLLTQDAIEAVNTTALGGELWITADGRVAYRMTEALRASLQSLAVGETATDSFTYAIQMGNGTLSWARVNFTVTGTNDTPIVQSVSIAADEDGPAVTGSFDGDDVDSDDDGSSLQYTLTAQPAVGTLTNNANGTFTYDPGSNFQELAAGETSTQNFRYVATDKHGAVSAPATGTIVVTGVNDTPTLASGGSVSVIEDGAASTLDLATLGDDVDSDNDGSNLTYTLLTTPAQGTASIAGTVLTFSPDDDYQQLNQGQSVFVDVKVQATDAHGVSVENTVKLNVTGVNDAPTLKAGTLAASEDGAAVTLDLAALGDDIDLENDGSNLKYALLGSSPTLGSASIAGTTLTFAPGTDFQSLGRGQTQVVNLTVDATDNQGDSAINDVAVTVTGVNDAPVITSGTDQAKGNTMEDTVLTASGQVTISDVDNGDTHSWSIATNTSGAYGSASVDSNGKWTYALANGTNGVASPVQSLSQGQTVIETFTVRASDGNGGNADQIVHVVVAGINDAAVITPQARSITETNAAQNTGGTLTLSDIDSPQTFNAQSSAGKYGDLTLAADGTWSYKMNGAHDEFEQGTNYVDTFSAIAADGTTLASAITVTIAGTNDAPTAVNDTNALKVTSLASQVNTTTVKWVDWTQASAGQVTGVIDLGGGQTIGVTYSGAYYFAQTNGGTDYYTTPATAPLDLTLGTGTYTSAGVANGPTGSDIIALGVATTRTLTFSQPVDNLFFAVVSLNGNGYRFDQDFDILSYGRGFFANGGAVKTALPDGRFELRSVANGYGQTELHGVLGIKGSVSSLTWDGLTDEYWNGFTVGTYGKAQTAVATGNLLANDSDPENNPLSVTTVNGQAIVGNSLTLTLASGASVNVNKNGNYSYDENGAFVGLAEGETFVDTFTYVAKDSPGALSNTATATITVTGINDAPAAANVDAFTFEDGAPVTAAFAGDDVDSDDDAASLTYAITAQPPIGTVTNNGDGTFNYDPGKNFQALSKGDAEFMNFTYTATDSHGTVSAPATISIKVGGTNDAPTMNSGAMAAQENGGAVAFNLAPLGNDIDNDNDGTNLVYALSAPNPNASIAGTTLTFNPHNDYEALAAGQTLDVTVGVIATDKHNASATNTVKVTVTGVNDAPVFTGGDASGAVTAAPSVAPFTVKQYNYYPSGDFSLASLQAYAAANAPSYTATTSVIDYSDDPVGFAGEIAGSSPWPAAAQTGANGTAHALNNNFFARITGQVTITTADTYIFRTFNDDGVYVHVNNSLIINDPGQHGEQAYNGSIFLNPGTYPIDLFFFENGGEASLEFSFKGSNGSFGHVTSGNLLDSGVLNFGDVDLPDSHTVSAAPVGTNLGTLTAIKIADTTGSGTGGQVKWDYSVNNDAVRYLGQGDTRVESFTIAVNDGKGGTATQQVNVTITGVNDAAVLGNAVVNLTETDAALSAGGTLGISDVDSGEAFFNVQSNTSGTYGKFSIAGNGAWSYNTNGALDFLAAGQVVSDVFGVTSIDGTTTTVTVNITGTALNIVAGGNLAQNGSFENSLTGWATLDGSVDRVSSATWQAAEGTWSLDLNAFSPGGVQQAVATQSGTEYGVFFQMSKNYDGVGTIPSATMRVTAESQPHQDYTFAEANSSSNMLWRGETYTFTADSANTMLSFESQTNNPINFAKGPALDDVVILANTIVNGFSTGDSDVLNLSNLLTSIGAPHNTTAFFDGHLRFLLSGADTLVQVDANGGGDDYITAVTLIGVWLNPAGDTDNYIL